MNLNELNAQWNQIMRTKIAEWNSSKRQCSSDIVAAVEQLVDIGSRQGNFYEDTPAGTQARKIGAELNQSGGMQTMRECHRLFALAVFTKETDYTTGLSLENKLEGAWDGIGQWLC